MNCDMYSYGLVLHEIAVGQSPWVDYVYEERHSGLASGSTEHNPDKIVLDVRQMLVMHIFALILLLCEMYFGFDAFASCCILYLGTAATTRHG